MTNETTGELDEPRVILITGIMAAGKSSVAQRLAAREVGRDKSGYSDAFTPTQFDRVFREETPRLGFWLDSSTLSVDETVDAIQANLPRAKVETGEDSTS